MSALVIAYGGGEKINRFFFMTLYPPWKYICFIFFDDAVQLSHFASLAFLISNEYISRYA